MVSEMLKDKPSVYTDSQIQFKATVLILYSSDVCDVSQVYRLLGMAFLRPMYLCMY